MLRRASFLLGLAVLLSLLFPVQAWLKQGGVDPLVLRVPGVDLAVLCVLVAVPASLALEHDSQLTQRLSRWSPWLAALPLFCLLFLLLHVEWTREFANSWLKEEVGPRSSFPLPLSSHALIHGIELVARFGVLACLMGALINLHGPAEAEPEPPLPRPGSRSRNK